GPSTRSGADRGGDTNTRRVFRLEARPDRRTRSADVASARTAALSQGPLLLPFLHPRAIHARHSRGVGRRSPPDRFAPPRPPPADLALVANEGPGTIALLVGSRRRVGPRPAAVLAGLRRKRAARLGSATAAPGRANALA